METELEIAIAQLKKVEKMSNKMNWLTDIDENCNIIVRNPGSSELPSDESFE